MSNNPTVGGRLEAHSTIKLNLCGTGILPVGGGLEAHPTIKLNLRFTGILPVPKNNNQQPKNHAPSPLHRENHARKSAQRAGLLRTRRQSI